MNSGYKKGKNSVSHRSRVGVLSSHFNAPSSSSISPLSMTAAASEREAALAAAPTDGPTM